jgi:hypothetical protein
LHKRRLLLRLHYPIPEVPFDLFEVRGQQLGRGLDRGESSNEPGVDTVVFHELLNDLIGVESLERAGCGRDYHSRSFLWRSPMLRALDLGILQGTVGSKGRRPS